MKTNLEVLGADIYHYIQWTDSSNNLSLEECRQLATDLAILIERIILLDTGNNPGTIVPPSKLSRINSLANLFILTKTPNIS